MEQTVRLLGDLGERYGVEHTYFNLRTPADAIKLLCINKPEFQEELIHAHENGIGYRLIQAGTDLDYADLKLPLGSNDLILTPVITGSGEGSTGKILAGVGLVALAIILGPAAIGAFGVTLGGAGIIGGAAATAIGSIGASLVLGGISQMLSPQPTIPNVGSFGGANRLSSGENISTDGPQSVVRGSDGRQSYAYGGAANTVGVGATIPVVYGEALVGSHLISARVDVADDSDPLKTAIKTPGPETILVGSETVSGLVYASGLRTRQWNPGIVKSLPASKFRSLGLLNGNSVKLQRVDPKEDIRADNYMVFFELSAGLFDFVSGSGTTLVDAFITYKIETSAVPNDEEEDKRFTTSTVQGTIQGLLLPGQTYRWMHYISYSQVEDTKNMDTILSIVDFRSEGGPLNVLQNGYELFGNSALNTVPLA